MHNILKTSHNKGSILILAIWTLGFLSILAVQIGVMIRGRIELISRIEQRSQLHFLAEAGVKKGISAIKHDIRRNDGLLTSYGKFYLYNNEEMFKDRELGQGFFTLSYDYYEQSPDQSQMRYGILDEESKININTSEKEIIERLLYIVTQLEDEQREQLVLAIIDWRDLDQSQLDSYSSDNYYQSLEEPYKAKNGFFEVIEELLLVEGMTIEVYNQLMPFITIYGDGLVNINTASKVVLMGLGLDSVTADKVLLVRNGFDEREATVDDFIFDKTHDVASDVLAFTKLEPHENRQLDSLNQRFRIKTFSDYFLIQGESRIRNKRNSLRIKVVYNLKDNWVEYWREKN